MAHPHSNLTRQVDNIEIDVASLAAITGVLGASRIDGSRAHGFRTVSQRGMISIEGTGTAGGPLMIGFMQGGFNLAELEEAIENDPQSRQDEPAMEQAGRRYYLIGYLPRITNSNPNAVAFHTKHQLSVIEGVGLQFFAYNTDLTSAISATTQVKIFCEHLGVWLRD